jgi:hypothetical protein
MEIVGSIALLSILVAGILYAAGAGQVGGRFLALGIALALLGPLLTAVFGDLEVSTTGVGFGVAAAVGAGAIGYATRRRETKNLRPTASKRRVERD